MSSVAKQLADCLVHMHDPKNGGLVHGVSERAATPVCTYYDRSCHQNDSVMIDFYLFVSGRA